MNKLVEIATKIDGAKVSEWRDRYYVNLPANKAYRGDRTTKVWIKGDVMTVEAGRGCRSDGFDDALRALIEAVEAAGAVRKGYSDSISATYTIA